MHDVVEDSETTVGMIVDAFSWRIAEMVDRLTRDRPDGSKLSVEEILNNAYAKDDKEVLLIKVVDRLHNIQTIEAQVIEKQKKTSIQTLSAFLPYLIFLGKYKLEQLITKLSLNNLGFKEDEYQFKNNSQLIALDF